MKISTLLFAGLALLTMITQAQTVTDIDGNTYNTVTIGGHYWIKENLKTTKFNDGTSIPLVTDNTSWSSLSTPGFCYYQNDAATYNSTYGALYNWYVVNEDNLCPGGWTIPSDDDWTVLSNYLGSDSIAGGKMKESGTSHWISPNSGATNSSEFTGLPGGYRDNNGSFSSNKSNGRFWSSSEINSSIAWGRTLFYDSYNLGKTVRDKKFGLSVRCISNSTKINEINFKEIIKVYPNPSESYVIIEGGKNQESLLQIINIYGKVIIEKQINGQTEIELQSKGVYIVRLSGNFGIITKKLIIQ